MLKFQMPMKHLNEIVQQVPVPAGNLSLEVWINLIITSNIQYRNNWYPEVYAYIGNQQRRGHQPFKSVYLLIF